MQDQVLIRGVVTLVQTINEIADDLKQEPAPARGLTSLVTTSDDEESDGEKPPGFTLVDELFQLVVDKYSSLQAVRREIDEYERRQADEDEIGGYIQFGGSKDGQVIVLSITEIVSAIEEYAGTLRRVSRLVSTRSPDSSVGWEAQELWDQALFIPPHEEIQDLEREIQRLCRQVEQSILHDRFVQQLPSRSIGIQTDLSACVGPYQRQRANAFLVTAPSFRGVQPTGRALEQAEEGPHPRVLKRQEVMQVPSTVQEDQHELLRLLPDGFRDYIDSIPAHYVPHQLSLSVVHGIISNLFNHMWQLVQEDHHQPRKFGPTSTSHAFIQVAPIHEYVYRIYLNHFRVPVFVVCRLLDLIVSISRLDTQSCKVQLFCRLLGLRGVEGLPQDAFWFVLKTLHVLQRSCLSTGNYFLLDGEGENEFVPHASAWEALNMLFAGSTNDVTKRLRLRLSGLSSVYGTIWIPAYNIVMFVIEECKLSQDALRFTLEQKIFLDADNQSNQATKRKEDFAGVFASMHLKVNRLEMVKLYRDLISQSRRSHSGDEFDSDGIDPDAFRHHWVRAMQTFINQAHQQQVNPPQPHGFQGGNSSHHHSNLSVGVHLGPPSDSMLAANEVLSKRFLRATWEQIKSEIIRFLDVSFSDIGLQVRLIQQMENAVKDQEAPSKHGWRVLQQLVQIAYSSVE
ncbi:TPA: hypothetical protein N0F65_006742 [Lagenidium giganteum]|uniref:Spindle pole body component n=1 Tax=Lagenidium giganteum TaxID=4803 RepID=A0AAV2YXF4_9STRA|nr:TPA: hypothetical protein N0F65_006742 [Lagenidium giganteum]